MSVNPELQSSVDEYVQGKLSRRGFLVRAAAVGVSAAVAAEVLAACSSGASDGSSASATGAATGSSAAPTMQPLSGGIFKEGYDRDLTPPDPVRNAWADPSFNAFFEAVIVRNPEGNPVPMLAEAFDYDDTSWNFTIREGLTFHSGEPCTPASIVTCFDLYRSPDTGQNGIFWSPITKVSASGQVVTCALSAPFAAFQETVTTEYSYAMNPAAREKAGDTWGSKVIDGNGPFQLGEFTPGQKLTATRWEQYPGTPAPFITNKGVAYLEGIEWVPITQASQRAPEIETGNVDAVKNPPPQDVERLKSNPELVVQEFQELSNFFLSVNVGDSSLGFDDVRVRQAISHAIDREGIVQSIFLGQAVATYGPIMPGNRWYDPAVEQYNQYDPEKSQQLLDEAGWTAGADGIREKSGKKLSFATYQLNEAVEVQVMQAVAEQLKQVGIDMKVEALDGTAFFPKLTNETTSYAFKWLWSSPIDVCVLFVQFYQPAGKVVDATMAAYKQWQTAADDAGLQAGASAVQMDIAQQLGIIPIYTPNTIWVNSSKVMGWQANQANLYPFYNDVWLAL